MPPGQSPRRIQDPKYVVAEVRQRQVEGFWTDRLVCHLFPAVCMRE